MGAFANLRGCRTSSKITTTDLPPCGGDVRQDRGGRRRAQGSPASRSYAGAIPAFCITASLATFPNIAQAACPIELAIYGDRENAASVEFTPSGEGAAITNAFRMLLDQDVVLDGVVMWSEGVARPNGMLMHKCPEGDVTGEELAVCTVWQGVIYTSDTSGNIELLPAEGVAAPEKLIFPDLGYALRNSSAYGADGFLKVPWDVFAMKGCQE